MSTPAAKTIAILQSNYIPWKGYFDIIAKADIFVVYDEVQFTKNDWRNRNIIKSASGDQWITIPVRQHSLSQRISETVINQHTWIRKHQMALETCYAKAPCYQTMRDRIFQLFPTGEMNLSKVNTHLINGICEILGIETPIIDSRDLSLAGDRVERLIDACKKLGGTHYLSGEAARTYLDESTFTRHGIALEWMDYADYPEYRQIHGSFNHNVSVLDLIFHMGDESSHYLKYTKK